MNMSYHFGDDGYFLRMHEERLEGPLLGRPPDKVKKHKAELRMDVQSINIFHYKHLKRFKEEMERDINGSFDLGHIKPSPLAFRMGLVNMNIRIECMCIKNTFLNKENKKDKHPTQ